MPQSKDICVTMRTFLGGLIKQPRKSTISMAVWTKRPRKWELFLAFRWNSQGKAQFPWRFDEKAKEMRTFLGVICKPPRQFQFFLAAYKICHEIIFSWLLTSTAKVTLYSLAVQSWPPSKSLAAKVIRFWCSVTKAQTWDQHHFHVLKLNVSDLDSLQPPLVWGGC